MYTILEAMLARKLLLEQQKDVHKEQLKSTVGYANRFKIQMTIIELLSRLNEINWVINMIERENNVPDSPIEN